MEEKLTLIGLSVENLKRVVAVRITPRASGVVKIAGKNGAGKSSTLDAIEMALGGKSHDAAVPIRRGERSARVVLDLPGLKVTRRWTPTDSYLEVERPGQGPVRRPQEFLDGLVGAGLGFDPFAFLALKPAKQVETLLGLLTLPEDPRRLDAERQALYAERTIVHREVKTLEARLRGLAIPEGDVPEAEISVAELVKERDRLAGIRDENAAFRRDAKQAAESVLLHEREVARVRAELVKAEQTLAEAKQRAETARVLATEVTEPDLGPITAQIAGAEATNMKVRQARDRTACAIELRGKERQAEDLTAAMAKLDDRKKGLLAQAPFPVEGLGFELVGSDYVVTFGGIPLADCASNEQIRVGLAIAMATNPTVRVVLIRDGSLLDRDTVTALDAWARERNCQVWTELVGEDVEGAFTIREGSVVSWPQKGAPATVRAEPGSEPAW